jgi:3-oxoacyl-[acyl-carrier-protein] synthase III
MANSPKKRPDAAQPSADVSDEMVAKVGAAVGQVAVIRKEYTQRVQSAASDDEKEQLADQAEQAAVKAIDDQGISVSDYNRVVTAASDNPDLEERLLQAVRATH